MNFNFKGMICILLFVVMPLPLIANTSVNTSVNTQIQQQDGSPRNVSVATQASKAKPVKETNAVTQANNSPDHTTYLFEQLPSFARLTFDQTKISTDKVKKIGMLGASYLFGVTPWFYIGPSTYSGVSGNGGGFYAIGFESGVQHSIFKNLWGDLGVFFGGGGGRSTPVGGGLMVRPHVGLSYDFGFFRFGVNYSQVRFPKGKIDSRQLALALDIPLGFSYANPIYNQFSFSTIRSIIPTTPGDINFSKNSLALIAQTDVPSGKYKLLDNTQNSKKMHFVGIEGDHYITLHTFLFAKTVGLYSGAEQGYLDALGGIGYTFSISRFSLIALTGRFGVGSGGGGNIDTGGGLLLEPELGINFQLTRSIGAELSGGYLYAPDGKFSAKTITGRLIYRFLSGHFSQNWEKGLVPQKFMFRGWRFRMTSQTYLRPQRTNNRQKNTSLVAMKFDSFVTRYIYLTGQGTSAYQGLDGGYLSGLMGLGVQSPQFLNNKVDVSVEMLGGAAGGSHLDVGSGAILQPMINVDYYITPYISAEISTGRIYAVNGKLNATTVDAGFAWHFSTLMGA